MKMLIDAAIHFMIREQCGYPLESLVLWSKQYTDMKKSTYIRCHFPDRFTRMNTSQLVFFGTRSLGVSCQQKEGTFRYNKMLFFVLCKQQPLRFPLNVRNIQSDIKYWIVYGVTLDNAPLFCSRIDKMSTRTLGLFRSANDGDASGFGNLHHSVQNKGHFRLIPEY